MKIPPPPLTYDKDRGITRRTVKGAAGGMKGVDYEDDGRPDPSTKKSTVGAGSNADSHAVEGARHARQAQHATQSANAEGNDTKVREDDEMVLDDEDAVTRDKKAKEARRNFVPRDRMTVDKDAPQLLHKPKWNAEDEEDEPDEEEEVDLELLGEAIAAHDLEEAFDESTRRRPGDPALTDPAAIQRHLGAPLHYAKHVMILAEAFRSATGATRDEAVGYLAAMFCAAPDRSFGRLALKEFGPATGILDIYPLEVVEHVLAKYPAFLPKVGFGRLFADVPRDATRPLLLIAGEPTILTYPPQMKVRGFAIRGGARPGYRFEPAAEPGEYTLTVDSGGEFVLLISALVRSGHTILDRLHVQVAGEPCESIEHEWPERDEAKVAAWPIPTPEPIDPREVLDEPDHEEDASLMRSSEIVQKQQLGALRGPKGEDYEHGYGFADEEALEADIASDEDDDRFSLDSQEPLEVVEGPPTDEFELPPDLLDDDDDDAPLLAFDDVTNEDLDVLGAPTFDDTTPVESNAASAMRRIREEVGGDPYENALSVADKALLDIAFATLADAPPHDEEE